ncbi:MAG: hypothetical protein EOO47_26855 [Flavobacterium sp.]|nr:MAG: hypothetical protein EOO47_26855 [Flavobacterium sp.]
MERTKKIIFYVLLGLSIFGIPVFAFGIINTMVSQKYETDNLTDCISRVTGQDLCFAIQMLQVLIVVCIATIILLMFFRKRFFGIH